MRSAYDASSERDEGLIYTVLHLVVQICDSCKRHPAFSEELLFVFSLALVSFAEPLLGSLAALFGVDPLDVYNEDNSMPVEEIEQGDRVCIRNIVSPVSVKMVESGRMRETVEFKTIKKESDEYYKGDSILEQEGQNGIQVFEGTITKVAGEETNRKATKEPDIIRKKKDKIIIDYRGDNLFIDEEVLAEPFIRPYSGQALWSFRMDVP